MGSYSSTTGYISLYAGGGWEAVTFPAISGVPSSESFSQFKVTKSNTLSYIEIENSAGTQTLSFDTWYSTYSYINSSFSAPKIKARNTGSSTLTTTFTLTVETTVSSYSVTVTAGTGGTATPSASSASPGATITITCSPSTGYKANTPTATNITFTSAGTNKWTFTMPSSNVSVSCTFSKISYTITTAVSPSGSGSLSSNKATANYGDTVTLTPSAGTGYSFSSYSSSPSVTISSNQFTMPASNVTITANFTKVSYTITTGVSPSGSGTLSASKSTANYGDSITLTPTPGTGYQFSSWTKTPSGLSITNNAFTMPAQNVSVTANYTKINYTVTVGVSPSGGGTLTTDKATATYGETVTLTPTPATGYQFSSWTKTPSGLSITNNTFTMPAQNVSITAVFTKINYTVTVVCNPAAGGTLSTNKATANYGDTVTLTPAAATGYSFSSYSKSPSTLSISNNQFTMPAQNVSITANWSKVSYTVTVGVSPSGSGTLTTNKATANYTDTVTLTPTPATGYQFSSWTKSPTNLSINNSNQFSMPAQNVSVTANFTKISYLVTVGSNPAAGGTLTTNKANANYGDTVTLTATPATGYHFSSWTKSPSNLSINGSNQFTMPAQNVSVTANWAKTIVAVVAGNKILATDRSQKDISTTAGDVMRDSHFTAGTKIEASTFNSQVLGL